MDLAACREALNATLKGLGYNVSDGADLVPDGAMVSTFVVSYHRTMAGPPSGLSVAGCEVRLVTGRADEASATERLDNAMSLVWRELERATGPWHALIVQSARPDQPITSGDATYQSIALIVELHV